MQASFSLLTNDFFAFLRFCSSFVEMPRRIRTKTSEGPPCWLAGFVRPPSVGRWGGMPLQESQWRAWKSERGSNDQRERERRKSIVPARTSFARRPRRAASQRRLRRRRRPPRTAFVSARRRRRTKRRVRNSMRSAAGAAPSLSAGPRERRAHALRCRVRQPARGGGGEFRRRAAREESRRSGVATSLRSRNQFRRVSSSEKCARGNNSWAWKVSVLALVVFVLTVSITTCWSSLPGSRTEEASSKGVMGVADQRTDRSISVA